VPATARLRAAKFVSALRPATRAAEETALLHWKQEQFSRGLLQGLQEIVRKE
jgi:hypothetical protein